MILRSIRLSGFHVTASIFFEPHDCWIGVYWKRPFKGTLDVYICVLPMLPIYFIISDRRTRGDE